MSTSLIKTEKIKKAEVELKKISAMRRELQRYGDSSIKSILVKSCELCEVIWELELEALKSRNVKKKNKSDAEKQFEHMSCAELEEIAFDIHTPDNIAQMALAQLIRMA